MHKLDDKFIDKEFSVSRIDFLGETPEASV